jgi:hypothetical protein
MEIPMKDVINSYRQQLSDVVHTLTLRDLHIKNLEKTLEEKCKEIEKLQMEIDFRDLANENLNDHPDEWEEPHGDHDSRD